jgi:dihydrofolate synthase/folylpolyglutamate synthase
VAKIAFEKAGILKSGVPAVIARQAADGAAVIETRARELGAPLYRQGEQWDASPRSDGGMLYRGRLSLDLPPPGLLGRHQYDNAGTALACIECFKELVVSRPSLAEGMRRVEWPARLQRLAQGRLARCMPEGAELWLDGAHNAAGGAVLGAVAKAWRDKRLNLVFGTLRGAAGGDRHSG